MEELNRTMKDIKSNESTTEGINYINVLLVNKKWLCESLFLAPMNETVGVIIEKIMSQVEGEVEEYISVNNVKQCFL